jgi:hypothetical protein
VDFVRNVLDSISANTKDPSVAGINERAAVGLYGLNETEIAAIHAAGISYGTALLHFREGKAALEKLGISETDEGISTLSTLQSEFARVIADSAGQFLQTLRSEVFAHIHSHALVAAEVKAGRSAILLPANSQQGRN